MSGEAKLHDGFIKGLSTLHRSYHCSLSEDGGRLLVKADFGAGQLDFSYAGSVKFMNFGPTITVHGILSYIGVHIEFTVDSKSGKEGKLEKFILYDMRGMTVWITGLGPLNWAVNPIISGVKRIFERSVRNFMETKVEKHVSERIPNFQFPVEDNVMEHVTNEPEVTDPEQSKETNQEDLEATSKEELEHTREVELESSEKEKLQTMLEVQTMLELQRILDLPTISEEQLENTNEPELETSSTELEEKQPDSESSNQQLEKQTELEQSSKEKLEEEQEPKKNEKHKDQIVLQKSEIESGEETDESDIKESDSTSGGNEASFLSEGGFSQLQKEADALKSLDESYQQEELPEDVNESGSEE